MAKELKQALEDRAFFYVSPNNDLNYLDDGSILTPSIGGGAICKAYWVKDSPQHVTLLSEVYETKDKMKNFLQGFLEQGVNRHSVIELAEGFGGREFADEVGGSTPSHQSNSKGEKE
tara:strand:+ start:614 stop:964 length:351 start_codon:yes stop_codon:yes gene_type:complete